jgi:predicted DsbA family dithiol-disulfide isomerase
MPLQGMDIPAEYQDDMEDTRARLRKMADAAGLKMVFSDRIPNSRRALEATQFATARGMGREFHRAVFHKLYGEGRDIGGWDALREAAWAVGLDADAMQHDIDSGRYSADLDARLSEAKTLGIKAVPTYILNDKYRIVGAQPFETFQRAIAKLDLNENS